MEIERRAVTGLEVRAADGGPTKIVGYAAVFNSMSEDLGGFREVVMPGAFDRAIREGHDVRALKNHDPNYILGRTKSGTLALSIDERGLRAEITPPDTQAARDTVEETRRGDLDGMSFGFRTLTDNWRMEDGNTIRELLDLELLDVSVVAFPAYPATTVSARALERAKAAAVPPPPPPAGVPNEVNAARLRLQEGEPMKKTGILAGLLLAFLLALGGGSASAAVVEVVAGQQNMPAVTLGSSQTGNVDSTNTLDRGAIRGPALLRIVSTIGATPTVTVNILGSMDNSNFYNVAYALAATPETPVVAAITITTATTGFYVLRPAHPWRYLKLNYSANTNVTLTAVINP